MDSSHLNQVRFSVVDENVIKRATINSDPFLGIIASRNDY
jgi:predicted metalloprotease